MEDNKKMLGKTDGKVINQKIVGENLKSFEKILAPNLKKKINKKFLHDFMTVTIDKNKRL